MLLTTYLFLLLFLGMIGHLSYLVLSDQQEMLNNSYNSRQEILSSRNFRGTIYSHDGLVLAQTVQTAQGQDVRIYPYKNLFAHVVGYSTKGRTGVEAAANHFLIQTNIPLADKAANDAAGRKNPGDSVYTTLDVELQQTASDEMGIYKGAVIVTEVATGKILSMVSQPDFDPNQIADMWEDLLERKDSSILLNRAVRGLYPPGSTFKIVTALEYIRERPETFGNYRYECNGSYKSGDIKISCYHGIKHGTVDLVQSFAESCNSSFANIGLNLDRKRLASTLESLLFNRKLPIELDAAESSVLVSEDTTAAQMIQLSIGQGKDQITPIHLHMITSAIANGGILQKPYVIDRVENDVGKVTKAYQPKSYGALMSETEADILAMLMEKVVEGGTGKKLSGRGYTAAGKTGSAEFGEVKGESHSWFTGFAPVQNPQVCITVILEGAGSGGDYAVPVARRVLDAYFQKRESSR
ncbi:MAG: penicillin-binding protein 2 [Clostridium sp.]|nr:penicillin-binding protein 2 [Clostridium sp.]